MCTSLSETDNNLCEFIRIEKSQKSFSTHFHRSVRSNQVDLQTTVAFRILQWIFALAAQPIDTLILFHTSNTRPALNSTLSDVCMFSLSNKHLVFIIWKMRTKSSTILSIINIIFCKFVHNGCDYAVENFLLNVCERAYNVPYINYECGPCATQWSCFEHVVWACWLPNNSLHISIELMRRGIVTIMLLPNHLAAYSFADFGKSPCR